MNLSYMMQRAETIATLLLDGSRQLSKRTPSSLPLAATLSIMAAAEARDVDAFDAVFKEIVLFGSTARGENNPCDLDLMIFDGGFYSNVLGFEPTETRWDHDVPYSSYGGMLQDNLDQLLMGWFEHSDEYCRQFDDVLVDLHVLPIALLTNIEMRKDVGLKHDDPAFFENAFSTILRFDELQGKFVPTTPQELEDKHRKRIAERV